MHQMFLVQLWKKATITGHFGLVLQEIFSSEITWLSCSCRFEKFCFEKFISNEVYKCFSMIFSHISSVLLCLKLIKLSHWLGQSIVFSMRARLITPFRLSYAREIWKPRIHSENARNVQFSSTPHTHEGEISKRATITVHFGFVLREILDSINHMVFVQSPFRIVLFWEVYFLYKCFSLIFSHITQLF